MAQEAKKPNTQKQVTDAVKSQNEEDVFRPKELEYKFMTNIAIEPKHRSKYIPQLEKLTADPRIPFNRLIIAMVAGVIFILVGLWTAFGTPAKTPYVWFPAILFVIAGVILVFHYMISSRDESMLTTALRVAGFKVFDRWRTKNSKNGEIQSVGIKDIRHGVIIFDDGDYGVLYDVAGQMSMSMLPAVAEAIASMRAQYFMARSDTSQETLITYIQPSEMKTQMRALSKIANKNMRKDSTLENQWKSYMAQLNMKYINDNILQDETMIKQALLLREVDLDSLKKSRALFESSAENGVYANVRVVAEPEEIIKRLDAMMLLSPEAERKQAQNATKRSK